VAAAIQAYHVEHGHLPTDILDKRTGQPLLSWRVAILPYMEQRNLYKQFKLDEPWDSEHNKPCAAALVKLYSAWVQPPLGPDGYGRTLVKRFTGPDTLHRPGEQVDVTKTPDGRATTLLLAEVGDPVPWTKPDDPAVVPAGRDKPFTPKDPPVWRGPFANVINVAFADGSAASLKPDLERAMTASLIYWNDGRVLPGRGELLAALPAGQDAADFQELSKTARGMADLFVRLAEEEAKLRGELAGLNKEPADTATPLADRLIEFDAQLRGLGGRVEELRKQVDQAKKKK
jgi:prepilin-type processing-associated H-X9-DG protein